MRRCFSMSGLDSDESWVAEGPEEDEPNKKNAVGAECEDNFREQGGDLEPRVRRYSFPMSPRRLKELPNTDLFER